MVSIPATEVSTRNCYNCLVDGEYVACRKDRILSKHAHRQMRLSYEKVLKSEYLYRCCRDCPDFDNDWVTEK